ncbi:MAG: 6-bladed beta-propeller, partial [Dysgonamonadaceae bacterium]|nr:6-bladed beta-propeller [Dysgonamonadaceae bacterium]
FITVFFLTGSCSKNKNLSSGNKETENEKLKVSENEKTVPDILCFDIDKKYPEKKITLQDIAEVNYISLETNNEFLCNGIIEFVSDKIIICNNSDGTILIFDGTGKV